MPSQKWEVERRTVALVEFRLDEPEGMRPKMAGHAAVFDELSEEIFGFKEKIRPGAFARTIQQADVRALWNHDANFVLGRSKSGTLRLAEDARGLAVEIDPPKTQWARDLLVTMRRGDVDQMSFGFRVIRESWEGTAGEPVRVLEEVELFDVSPVTFPAYPQTDVSARSAAMQAALAPSDPRQEPHSEGLWTPGWQDQQRRLRLSLIERTLR